ncbi:hypothetical protein PHSC3_000472 [Chlamydiales bacterium STE3]|nr:hypothetical protein PHSC3_000472 [Chlamydiales bacterium STE3]
MLANLSNFASTALSLLEPPPSSPSEIATRFCSKWKEGEKPIDRFLAILNKIDDKATAIFKVFHQMYLLKVIAKIEDDEVKAACRQKYSNLVKDIKILFLEHYSCLKEGEEFPPLGQCSWNQKSSTELFSDTEYARQVAVDFLLTNAMPRQVYLALNLELEKPTKKIHYLKQHLEGKYKEIHDNICLLFNLLKEQSSTSSSTLSQEKFASLQLTIIRFASGIEINPENSSARYTSWLESILDWKSLQPKKVIVFLNECKFFKLVSLDRPLPSRSSRVYEEEILSFQSFIIYKTINEIQKYCPLPDEVIKSLALAFQDEEARRTACFYFFYLIDKFPDPFQLELIKSTLNQNESYYNKAYTLLRRLLSKGGRESIREIKKSKEGTREATHFLRNLTIVRSLDELTSSALSSEDKFFFLKEMSKKDFDFRPWPLLFNAPHHDDTTKAFTEAYLLFKQKYTFESNFSDFIHLARCFLALNLNMNEAKELLGCLINSSKKENDAAVHKLEQFASKGKVDLQGIAKIPRQKDSKIDRFLHNLPFVQAINNLTSFHLTEEDRLFLLHRAEIDFFQAPWAEILKAPYQQHIKMAFTGAYSLFKDEHTFRDNFPIFLSLAYTLIYLDLSTTEAEYLLNRFTDSKDADRDEMIKELQQYAMVIDKLEEKDPYEKRSAYLKKNLQNYCHKRNTHWRKVLDNWEERGGYFFTFDFLQAFEKCTRRRLPLHLTIRAFCYPFFTKESVEIIRSLNTLKFAAYSSNNALFLPENYNTLQELISQLQESEIIIAPGFNWLSNTHANAFSVVTYTAANLLQQAVLATPCYLKPIKFLSQLLFPQESNTPELSYFQNQLIFYTGGGNDNLSFIAAWEKNDLSYPTLRMTFIFALEHPNTISIKIPLKLSQEALSLPYTQTLFDTMLFELGFERQKVETFSENNASIEEELGHYIATIPTLKEVWKECFLEEGSTEIGLAIFQFVKELKIKARQSIASFFIDYPFSPQTPTKKPMVAASKKQIYSFPNSLSLLSWEEPGFFLEKEKSEAKFVEIANQILKASEEKNPLTIQGKFKFESQKKIDIFFEPKWIDEQSSLKKKKHGRYDSVTFSIEGKHSFTMHYGKYLTHPAFANMLRWQLLMFQSGYFEKYLKNQELSKS